MPLAAISALCTPMHQPLKIATLHERTYPNSNSYRVTGEDGGEYIVKSFPPIMARMLSYREALGNEIGTRLGFSMAHHRILQLGSRSRREYTDRAAVDGVGLEAPQEGLYFGTRVLDGPGQLRNYLSEKLIQMNPEVARQLGCIKILDTWLANSGTRHYAAMVEDNYPAHVYFFSNSSILVPENPNLVEERVYKAHQAACRITADPRVVEDCFQAIRNFTDVEIRAAIRAVPPLWRDPCLEAKTLLILGFRRDWLTAMWHSNFSLRSRGLVLPVPLLRDTTQMTKARASVTML